MRRTERLFALAEYLRGRRTGVNAAAIAEERFGITIRTAYRDLDALRDAAMPVNSERGRGGGFALDRSYALPPVNFSAREAALLVMAGRWLVQLRLIPFVETLAGALDKVQAALPARAQRELDAMMKTLMFVGVPAHQASPQVRKAVEQAWFEHKMLEIEYDGAIERTRRRVQLSSVVLERTETLLNCLDAAKGEQRQFKLHKITFARVVGEAVGHRR